MLRYQTKWGEGALAQLRLLSEVRPSLFDGSRIAAIHFDVESRDRSSGSYKIREIGDGTNLEAPMDQILKLVEFFIFSFLSAYFSQSRL